MQKTAYNGTDFMLFSNPKFLADMRIAYLGLTSFIYVFKLIDFTLLSIVIITKNRTTH